MMGKRERDKGARAEREFVLLARPVWPGIERNYRQFATSDGKDFIGTPGFSIQAKSGALPPWRKGWDEAAAAAEEDEIPVCVTRRDREPWFVHMKWADFKLLARRGV